MLWDKPFILSRYSQSPNVTSHHTTLSALLRESSFTLVDWRSPAKHRSHVHTQLRRFTTKEQSDKA